MNLQPDVKAIFDQAIEIEDAAKRASFLDRVGAANAGLRQRVEVLLRAHDEAGSFLEKPAPGFPATGVLTTPLDFVAATHSAESSGTVIGPYKLLQPIGEGGMGAVFLAEQTQPVQRIVALKLIKPGLDLRQVVARFEAERQAALMDHPNIAKVLDAGTTDEGRPYFVMELVKGQQIIRYCDERRLTPRQRLELFIPVCQAVQHAHQKGIIHRDLKPSNVMVGLYDGKPMVKVIDFGVAKATGSRLTEKTLFTEFGAVVGSLEYMSPEQAQLDNLDIDTRSDIYSLGVLLYELLTGTTPLGRQRVKEAGLLEALRLIREEETQRPSARLSTEEDLPSIAACRGVEPAKLSGLVRGDLDWIVMKCLDKDRSRRYEAANDLALDVQRYLRDEPVLACPPGAAYRMKKFVRRNRGSVLAVGLVLFALVAGIVGTTWQAVQADGERAAAIRERNEKQTALDDKQQALKDETAARNEAMAALRTLTDEVVERQLERQTTLSEPDREFLRKILAHYEAFAALKGDTPASRAIRAEGYYHVGTLRQKLGEQAEALASYDQAVSLYERLAGDCPDVAEWRDYLGRNHIHRGNLLRQQGKDVEAEADYRRAFALYTQLVADFPKVPVYRQNLARGRVSLGKLFVNLGRQTEAEVEYRLALALRKQLAAELPKMPQCGQDLASSHKTLGDLLKNQGKYAQAEAEYRHAFALRKQLVRHFPHQPDYRRDLADSHHGLGGLLADQGKRADAEKEYGHALSLLKQLATDFPSVSQYRQNLARGHNNLGLLLGSRGKHADAEIEHRRCLALTKQLVADFPNEPDYRQGLAGSHLNLGALLNNQRKRAEAEEEYRAALALYAGLAADFPKVPQHRQQLGTAHHGLANLLRERGERGEAETEYRRALALRKQLAADAPKVPDYRHNLAASHNDLGGFLKDQGKNAEAEAEFRQGLALYTQLATDYPTVTKYAAELGGIYGNFANLVRDNGDPAKAVGWYQKAIGKLTPVVERDPRQVYARRSLRNSHWGLAITFRKLDRFADAVREWDRAIELDDGTSRSLLVMSRLRCLARSEPAKAVEAAEEMIKVDKPSPGSFYNAACICALSSAQVKDDQEQEKYASRAVALLQQARDRGLFKNVANVELLKKDTALNPLRQREDFKKLLAELQDKEKD